jgi:hypothetical protein
MGEPKWALELPANTIARRAHVAESRFLAVFGPYRPSFLHDLCTRVARHQRARYAMALRKQAGRPIACRSCAGRVPFWCVLRPSRLPERTHHCGRLLGPSACLMTVWGLAKPDSSCIRHAEGVPARVLARGRSLAAPSNPSVHALLPCNSAAGEPDACEPPRIPRRVLASIQNRAVAPRRRRTRRLPIKIRGRTRRAAACV